MLECKAGTAVADQQGGQPCPRLVCVMSDLADMDAQEPLFKKCITACCSGTCQCSSWSRPPSFSLASLPRAGHWALLDVTPFLHSPGAFALPWHLWAALFAEALGCPDGRADVTILVLSQQPLPGAWILSPHTLQSSAWQNGGPAFYQRQGRAFGRGSAQHLFPPSRFSEPDLQGCAKLSIALLGQVASAGCRGPLWGGCGAT